MLYDYWFTQFDFPDENDKPYRSSGGQMAWNDLLKKKQVFNVSMVLHIGVALLTGLILLAAMYPLFNGIFNKLRF